MDVVSEMVGVGPILRMMENQAKMVEEITRPLNEAMVGVGPILRMMENQAKMVEEITRPLNEAMESHQKVMEEIIRPATQMMRQACEAIEPTKRSYNLAHQMMHRVFANHFYDVVKETRTEILRSKNPEPIHSTAPVIIAFEGLEFEFPAYAKYPAPADYSRTNGHTIRPALTVQAVAACSQDFSGGGGGDGGGGDSSGGEEGGGDGDDDSHNFILKCLFKFFLLTFVCLCSALHTCFILPFSLLYSLCPTLPQAIDGLRYLFPDHIRRTIYEPELPSLYDHLHEASAKRWQSRLWIGFCVRVRAIWILVRCLAEWANTPVKWVMNVKRLIE